MNLADHMNFCVDIDFPPDKICREYDVFFFVHSVLAMSLDIQITATSGNCSSKGRAAISGLVRMYRFVCVCVSVECLYILMSSN